MVVDYVHVILILHSTEAILKGKGEKMSEDMKKRAMVLGWCIEWVTIFLFEVKHMINVAASFFLGGR